MTINPVLVEMATYPFVRLEEAYAHTVDEQIPIENLHAVYDMLARLLAQVS